MTSLSSSEMIPLEMKTFFEQVYGQLPELKASRKGSTYSIPQKEISVITDPYGGCHVDVAGLSDLDGDSLKSAIEGLRDAGQANLLFDSLWIDIALPAKLSALASIIPESFELERDGSGLIQDYQTNKLRVYQWLNGEKECVIPPGATHNIGATAVLIDGTAGKVLLVENLRRDGAWNLPGGSFDPVSDKCPAFSAIREAQEEGGFTLAESELDGAEPRLMGQMAFPFNQFAPAINQVWAYSMDGVSEHVLSPPADEIKRAEWVSLQELIDSDGILGGLKLGSEIKAMLTAAVNDLGCREISNKGWMIVHAAGA